MTDTLKIPIAVRAYSEAPDMKTGKPKRKDFVGPSEWALIFDTETTTDASQRLRVACYQLRRSGVLQEEGVIVDDAILSAQDLALVASYAASHGLKVKTLADFRRFFLDYAYWRSALVVGFNLPFDIARIAIDASEARRDMRGGFSFRLSTSRDQPSLRVKHLSTTAALIGFGKPGKQMTPRGMRKRGMPVQAHRGYFLDVKTLAAALTSRSFSLAGLSEHLGTPTRKQATDDHGGPITPDYLDYARSDVQATWECFDALNRRYQEHGLARPVNSVLSEASVGKAYLEQMGIAPQLQCAPDLDRSIFGPIMEGYYGGRAEVNLRRVISEVITCDFKSMYPTVNALMGLWRFVIGLGFTWRDTTRETQAFLDRVTLADFQLPDAWKALCVLVRIQPHGDLLPVRAAYDGQTHTIGQAFLTCDQPLWYTLADAIAARLRTGKSPQILEARTFEPGPMQDGLKPINLFGNPAFCVDPRTDDVFNRLIDLRDDAKARKDPVQEAIKIIANATSYGIFIEVNRDDAPKPEALIVIDGDGQRSKIRTKAIEEPGSYFHPLLGTLITGAARLMLALAEQLTLNAGLDWVFCDTDSLAIARPEGMGEPEFHARAQGVIAAFVPLNPYRKSGSILQIEALNLDADTGAPLALHAFAISSKRYALFNIDADGAPIIRKASAHGLGHLIDPYGDDDPAAGIPAPRHALAHLRVKRWQHDLWFVILQAALKGTPNAVRRDYHPALAKPAMMRHGATSPPLLAWMKRWNAGKPYADQTKPFGFLTALTLRTGLFAPMDLTVLAKPRQRGRPKRKGDPKPIAPFTRNPDEAAQHAFCRDTGEPVPPEHLKTYAEALTLYHVSREPKFANADFTDTGKTQRRHIVATGVKRIGKEGHGVGEAGEEHASPALFRSRK
jgi:hypothetical protein